MSFVRDVFLGGAERDAARAQERGFDRAIDEFGRQYDQTRADIAPAVEAGDLAREEELALLGLRGADAESAALARFRESPGQAFLRERAERALLRNSAAIGGLKGGNVMKALQREAMGLSGQFLGERKNRLRAVASGGDYANINRAAIGSGLSGNMANMMVGRGNATAQGHIGSANAIRNTIKLVAQAFTGSGMPGGMGGGPQLGGGSGGVPFRGGYGSPSDIFG